MPKIIKLKSLDTQDISVFDSVTDLVKIKICSETDLFTFDNYIPVITANFAKINLEKINLYLKSNLEYRVIVLDLYEPFSKTERFLNVSKMSNYADTQQLSVISSSGTTNKSWHITNSETLFNLVGTLYNQCISFSFADQIYNTKNKPYNFLFLNGVFRPHRHQLIKLLSELKLLDHSLWSNVAIGKTLDPQYENLYRNNNLIKKYINNTEHQLLFKEGAIIPNLYTDTYFSIVTETSFTATSPEPTEKIFKSILAGHPFVVVSVSGFYKHLRSLGYKTFSPWIDESFDSIENPTDRIIAISNSIKKLCSTDLDKFAKETQDICEHNKRIFLESHGRYNYDLRNRLIPFLEKFQ